MFTASSDTRLKPQKEMKNQPKAGAARKQEHRGGTDIYQHGKKGRVLNVLISAKPQSYCPINIPSTKPSGPLEEGRKTSVRHKKLAQCVPVEEDAVVEQPLRVFGSASLPVSKYHKTSVFKTLFFQQSASELVTPSPATSRYDNAGQ